MGQEEQYSKVPARQGKAINLSEGQKLKIINIHGHQVVDLWAFNANNLNEFLSLEHTRPRIAKYFAEEGDDLLSNRRRAVLHFEKDTWEGRHDTLMAACDIYRYQSLGCTEYHDNCTDNLYAAMRGIGLSVPACPSPLNVWMQFPVNEKGGIEWKPPEGIKEGDYVVFRAAMACIVVMSCCPMDLMDIHGDGAMPTDVGYSILG